MKLTCIVGFGLITALRHVANVSKFGPKNCVTISQSKNKTCVFNTNCKKEDIAQFEFAFTCTTADKEVAKHSFGLGGFDEKETFDTEVACETCGPPPEAVAGKVVMKKRNATVTPHKPKEEKPDGPKEKKPKVKNKKKPKKITKHVTNLHSKAAQDSQEEAKQAPVINEVEMKEDDADWYKLVLKESKVETGPDNCVSIFRKKDSSTCVIHTDCEKEHMDSYEFGLDCVDKNNMQVRHLFGRDSFLPNEWFDTLITCNLCLANSYSDTDTVQMDARLDKLEKSVTKLKDTMTTLEDKVDKVAKAEAPESDTPAKTDDEVNENPDEPAKQEEEAPESDNTPAKTDDGGDENPDEPAKEEAAPEPQQFMVKRVLKEANDEDDENERPGKRTKMVLKDEANEDEEDEKDEKDEEDEKDEK